MWGVFVTILVAPHLIVNIYLEKKIWLFNIYLQKIVMSLGRFNWIEMINEF